MPQTAKIRSEHLSQIHARRVDHMCNICTSIY
jgi:hypothetical protein